ncbi:enterobactin exporter EntS [Cesiribacter andamanensis AMV16]|uniref:Enterobactin exporter EntS n=2 Tax=Cesiribacter TaxID=1133570 RepID=M7P2B1_9BACT|nr:enterobactin exporter EntS [Cesiribacter andamanensis AMV16]
MLAIPWYFAQQGLSSRFNLLYAAVTFLTLFWGLYAGTLVDRFPRKGVFLGTNLLEGSLVLGIAALGFWQGELQWFLVMGVFAITLFGYQIHYPNLYAFAQEITLAKNYQKVTSLLEIVGQSTNVGAGFLAALLLEGVSWQQTLTLGSLDIPLSIQIPRWTIWEIFALDGATYFISSALIALIRYVPTSQLEVELGSILKRVRTGLHFLQQNRYILLFGLLTYSVFVVVLVELHAVAPLYITNHLREGGHVFGSMEVLYALGALSAGIGLRWLFRNRQAVQGIMLLMGLAVFSLGILAVTQSVIIFLGAGLLIGFSNSGVRILRVAYLFEHVPNNIIGRTNSVFSVANILCRVSFILLFSNAYFNRDSNSAYAYAIMALFVLLALLGLLFTHYGPSSHKREERLSSSAAGRMRPRPTFRRRPSSRASG